MANNQNHIKSKLSYIDTLDHEVPAVVVMMRDLTVGVLRNL